MSVQPVREDDQAVYWNEEGGQRWVQNIEPIEGMLRELSDTLIARVAPPPAAKVLDVGCGGGVTSAALAEAVGPDGCVLGVDISAVILEVARARYGGLANLRFATADAGSHVFEAASFDLITSRFGVMFFHDPVAAFSNLRRAARDDARLTFMCWRRLDENPWMGLAAAAAFSVIEPPPKPEPGSPGPFSFANPARVSDILTRAGFGAPTFDKIDAQLRLGTVPQALALLTRMGPAAVALREAPADAAAAAEQAMQRALASQAGAEGVVLGGATWLVSARAA